MKTFWTALVFGCFASVSSLAPAKPLDLRLPAPSPSAETIRRMTPPGPIAPVPPAIRVLPTPDGGRLDIHRPGSTITIHGGPNGGSVDVQRSNGSGISVQGGPNGVGAGFAVPFK